MSAPLILGTNSIKETGFDVTNSIRFNDDDSAKLSRTFDSGSNRKKFTFSCWVKRGNLGQGHADLFGTNLDSGESAGAKSLSIGFTSSNTFTIDSDTGAALSLSTSRVFRDCSAWFHFVVAVDTTQSTASNRIKFYVNGVQETLSGNQPSQNADTAVGRASEHTVGADYNSFFDGYMAEVAYLDDVQLDPTSFGQFNATTNIWTPKELTDLTFGDNGFLLEFKQSGTSQNSSGLGADTSGGGHHFACTNLASTDQSTDTCTNNFCVLNPLTKRDGSNGTLREGNLEYEASGSDSSVYGTISVPAGMKIYFEVKLISNTAQNAIGIHNVYDGGDGAFVKGGAESGTYSYKVRGAANDTQYFNNGSLGGTVVSNYSNGTIIGVAVDNANGQIHYSANGTFINSSDPTDNSPAALVTGFGGSNEQYLHFSLDTTSTQPKNQFNFGSPPYSISSGNSDSEGHGNFEYAVPSGYFALCTKNVAEYG